MGWAGQWERQNNGKRGCLCIKFREYLGFIYSVIMCLISDLDLHENTEPFLY